MLWKIEDIMMDGYSVSLCDIIVFRWLRVIDCPIDFFGMYMKSVVEDLCIVLFTFKTRCKNVYYLFWMIWAACCLLALYTSHVINMLVISDPDGLV